MKALKQLLFIACLGIIFCFNTSAQTLSLVYDNADSSLDVLKKHVDGFKNHNLSEITSVFAPDVSMYLPNGEKESLQEYTDRMKGMLNAYNIEAPEPVILPIKASDSEIAGEYVMVWGTITFTSKATGIKIPVPYHIISVVEDGKIVVFRSYYDNLNIFEKLGFTVEAPSAN